MQIDFLVVLTLLFVFIGYGYYIHLYELIYYYKDEPNILRKIYRAIIFFIVKHFDRYKFFIV